MATAEVTQRLWAYACGTWLGEQSPRKLRKGESMRLIRELVASRPRLYTHISRVERDLAESAQDRCETESKPLDRKDLDSLEERESIFFSNFNVERMDELSSFTRKRKEKKKSILLFNA